MTTKEEASAFLEKIRESKLADPMHTLTSKHKGMSFVLKYISDHNGEAFTHDISREMHISTARVSAIINKLEERGLVTRQASKKDARKTMIVLTQQGMNLAKEMEESLIRSTMYLIDTVGMEDLIEFLRITDNIKNAMLSYNQFHKKLEEIYND